MDGGRREGSEWRVGRREDSEWRVGRKETGTWTGEEGGGAESGERGVWSKGQGEVEISLLRSSTVQVRDQDVRRIYIILIRYGKKGNIIRNQY